MKTLILSTSLVLATAAQAVVVEGYDFDDTNTVGRICQMSAKEVDALPPAVRRQFFATINELSNKMKDERKARKAKPHGLKIDLATVAPEARRREREAFAAWRKAKAELAKAIAAAHTNALKKAAAATNATATATKPRPGM